MDWPRILRRFADQERWRPAEVLDGFTVPQLWLVYGIAGEARRRVSGAADLRAAVNRKRAEQGKPPLPEGRIKPVRANAKRSKGR